METQPHITIRCRTATPRLKYIAGYLSSLLQLQFRLVADNDLRDPYEENASPVVHYGNQPVTGAFNIFASGLLTETAIRNIEPVLLKNGEQVMLFPAPIGYDLPFDLFSAIFWMLTRYEEYLPFVPDRHGRFEAGQSLAFAHEFLNEPVVDQWVEVFKRAWLHRFPAMKFHEPAFGFVSTLDVDNPWAYLHKGWYRQTAGLIKHALRLDIPELRLRCQVLTGRCRDPFDIYDYLLGLEKKYGFRSRIFFLSGDYGQYDTNYALDSKAFRELIQRLKPERILGIHPSCRSNRSPAILHSEMERFGNILGEKPVASRQHFLQIKLAETYRRLKDMGIQEEYSMGYASNTGFRAGTSRPFRFYDLGKEVETGLMVHPFVVMDVTLQQYLGLTAREALDHINMLTGKVKAVKGVFTSLWHNESLSEQGVWKGWRGVFEEMVRMSTE